MAFLNPLLLIGLVAAGIPLLIHLFNVRRPRRVEFSSLAFLRELQQTTMQRVRVKQWLLLALRMLAIACLVIAFARPTIKGDLAGLLAARGNTAVAVVVDNSPSMTLRDDEGEYLAQAKQIAAGVVGQMEPGDEVFVLSTSGEGAGGASAFRSSAAAVDAVQEIDVERTAGSAQRAVGRAADLLAEARGLNREIYLVTDLQQSTLTDSVRTTLPEGARLFVLPVGGRQHGNVAVTDVQVASRIVEAGQPARVQATLTNYGTEALNDYVASLFLEGERVAQAAADLPPGAGTTVTFTATPQRRGWLAGTVQIEEDAFDPDNTRYFTLNVPEQRRLLIVQGEGQTARFVDLALSAELTQGRIGFEKEVIPEGRLAAANLGRYDAVLLVGPRDLSTGETASLRSYVVGGGGLFLFTAADARIADYNALLAGIGGGQIRGFIGTPGGEAGPVASFGRVDLEHPLFEGVFEGPQGPGGRRQVESPEIFHAAQYAPGGGTEQTLIALSTGSPFLQEIRHGQGTVFVMTVAPDPAWSDLPTRGLFIPLLYRSVFYLSSGDLSTGEQLVAGAPGELRIPGVPEGGRLRLVSPQGEEVIPQQRTLMGTALLSVDGTLPTPGVYDVKAGEQTLRRVAVNLSSRESDLRVLEADAAQEQLAQHVDGEIRVLDSAEDRPERVIEALSAQRYGREIWNVFLGLALLFLVAEMVVARQWRPEAVAA